MTKHLALVAMGAGIGGFAVKLCGGPLDVYAPLLAFAAFLGVWVAARVFETSCECSG